MDERFMAIKGIEGIIIIVGGFMNTIVSQKGIQEKSTENVK